MVMYHITKKSNINSIMTHGLIPTIGERSTIAKENKQGIYLFPSILEVENALGSWMGDLFDDDEELVVLKVLIPDQSLIEETCDYERVYRGTIPPQNISIHSYE